jgi:hypothetical protein
MAFSFLLPNLRLKAKGEIGCLDNFYPPEPGGSITSSVVKTKSLSISDIGLQRFIPFFFHLEQ